MNTEVITCKQCGKTFSIKYAIKPKSAPCPHCKARMILVAEETMHKASPAPVTNTSAAAAHHMPHEPSKYDVAVSRRSRRIGIIVAIVVLYLLAWGLTFLHISSLDKITGPIGWRIRAPLPFVYLVKMDVQPDMMAGFTSFVWAKPGTDQDGRARGCLSYNGYGDLFSYRGNINMSGSRKKKVLVRLAWFFPVRENLKRIEPLVRNRSEYFIPLDEVAKQAMVWIVVCNAGYNDLDRDIWLGDDKVNGMIKGMKLLDEVGFELRKSRIWQDRQKILEAATDGPLKQWLTAQKK